MLTDLARGRKSLMVAHGKDLWDRLRDVDNIWSISSEEDNFFSLDLDFLSEELAKVDIAERLFVDPKYIPAEEREKVESFYKDSRSEKNDGNESKTFSSLTSGTISEVSQSSKDVHVLQNSPAMVYKGGNEGISDYKWFREAATSSMFRERPDSSESNKFEMSDRKLPQLHNKIHTVLKDTLAELPKTVDDKFEAKSAEAELDALLDMLDDKGTGEASNLFSSMSLGYAKSQGSASQRSSYVDVLQGPLETFLASSNDSLCDTRPSFEVPMRVDHVPSQAATGSDVTSVQVSSEVAVKADYVPYQSSAVGNVSSVPDPDKDFDDWLDSL